MARVVQPHDEALKGKEVRFLLDDGQEVGIVTFDAALERAVEEGFDLVEIAGSAKPPVVKLMNYGKFIYEKNKREKLAKKKQQTNKAKEVKFHVNVDTHDYDYKCNHAKEFLKKGYKVKITLQFRGREMAHRELGFALMNKIKAELADLCIIEAPPRLQGRNMTMIIATNAKP
ncbi:MAG: translation initiation factor IF-3 [Lentisphaeraceae bacterium]|nr:translation initiation factor IF-3 [Lentisphaeraceae bacterium]